MSLALSDLLTVVDSSFTFVADLVYGDHMYVGRSVETAVAGKREPVAHHLPAGDLHGGDSCSEKAKWPLVGNRLTSPAKAMILAAKIGPTPKMSVRVVPEASGTSWRMQASRSAIRLLRARTSPTSSEANCRRIDSGVDLQSR